MHAHHRVQSLNSDLLTVDSAGVHTPLMSFNATETRRWYFPTVRLIEWAELSEV